MKAEEVNFILLLIFFLNIYVDILNLEAVRNVYRSIICPTENVSDRQQLSQGQSIKAKQPPTGQPL